MLLPFGPATSTRWVAEGLGRGAGTRPRTSGKLESYKTDVDQRCVQAAGDVQGKEVGWWQVIGGAGPRGRAPSQSLQQPRAVSLTSVKSPRTPDTHTIPM